MWIPEESNSLQNHQTEKSTSKKGKKKYLASGKRLESKAMGSRAYSATGQSHVLYRGSQREKRKTGREEGYERFRRLKRGRAQAMEKKPRSRGREKKVLNGKQDRTERGNASVACWKEMTKESIERKQQHLIIKESWMLRVKTQLLRLEEKKGS